MNAGNLENYNLAHLAELHRLAMEGPDDEEDYRFQIAERVPEATKADAEALLVLLDVAAKLAELVAKGSGTIPTLLAPFGFGEGGVRLGEAQAGIPGEWSERESFDRAIVTYAQLTWVSDTIESIGMIPAAELRERAEKVLATNFSVVPMSDEDDEYLGGWAAEAPVDENGNGNAGDE